MTPTLDFSMRPIAFALFALVSLAGCKDGLVAPERFGNIEGSVLNYETGEVIPRALVTTSPATDAITVGDDGRFTISDVLTGAYTLTASRNGFDPNTVTVTVRDGRIAQAALFLRPETDEENPTGVQFGAEVLGFTNEVFQTDSSFVTVEYRAINNGDVPIATYEVYFRIDTDRGPFYQEIRGTGLGSGQRDVATFRKRLIGARASVVVVEGTSAE